MANAPNHPVNSHGQISAGALRRTAGLAYGHDLASGSGNLGGFNAGSGQQTYDNTPKKKWLQLTANTGSAYGWTEQMDDGAGNPIPIPGAFQGTATSIPAYEINGVTTVPVNTYVWAEPADDGMSLLFIDPASGGGPLEVIDALTTVTGVSEIDLSASGLVVTNPSGNIAKAAPLLQTISGTATGLGPGSFSAVLGSFSSGLSTAYSYLLIANIFNGGGTLLAGDWIEIYFTPSSTVVAASVVYGPNTGQPIATSMSVILDPATASSIQLYARGSVTNAVGFDWSAQLLLVKRP